MIKAVSFDGMIWGVFDSKEKFFELCKEKSLIIEEKENNYELFTHKNEWIDDFTIEELVVNKISLCLDDE